MFLKRQEREGRVCFFLCIAERGGNAASSGKSVEYSVCLGESLDLTSEQWVEVLLESKIFRSVSLGRVLETAEKYAAKNGFRFETLDGLRDAVRGEKRVSQGVKSERRSQDDERSTALRVLGLWPGASDAEIELAFRRAARRCHPDAGGDPARFRAIVNARNLLLGREGQPGEIG
jgi:hypothetical protein